MEKKETEYEKVINGERKEEKGMKTKRRIVKKTDKVLQILVNKQRKATTRETH